MNLKLFGGRILINVLFIPIGIFMCYLMGFAGFSAFLMTLFAHECAHAIAARAVGLRVSQMEVLPFGCAAKIESFGFLSGGKEIAVAVAGPFINIIIAAAIWVYTDGKPTGDFTLALLQSNILLATINLLPALPLDGGRIVSVILSLAMRRSFAIKITGFLGIITSLAMLGFGGYVAYTGNFNLTPLIMGLFMLISAIKTLKNSAYSMLKSEAAKRDELARHPVDVHTVAAHEHHSLADVVSNFNARKYNIVHILGEDMRIKRRMDESEILDKMISRGSDSKL